MLQKKPFKVIKLEFISQLHIGLGAGNQYDNMDTLLHSDTISGALASAYVSLFNDGQVLEFMQSFTISSAFPFQQNHYFLPKPLMRIKLEQGNKSNEDEATSLDGIEYIELPLYQTLIADGILRINHGRQSEHKKFLWAGEDSNQPSFMKSSMQQRLMVPRYGIEDAASYYIERLFFSKGSGLFFFIEASADALGKVASCLSFLETSGFGTDKSVGNGQFRTSTDSISIDVPVNSNYHLLLSLYCPGREEISEEILQKSAYHLTRRGGYIAGTSIDKFRHLRSRSIYMMREGAVMYGNVPKGKIINLRPSWNDDALHPVWRDGRAFSVPVAQNNAHDFSFS